MLSLSTGLAGGACRLCCTLALAAALAALPALPGYAADTQVNIDNFTFKPKDLTVKAGSAIVFLNRDDIPHSVVETNGSFHSKALDTDESFSYTFTKPGTYDYFCGLHPQMKGKIVVTP